MFTIGIFTSHLPYVIAFTAYIFIHFSDKPQLPHFVDTTFNQTLVTSADHFPESICYYAHKAKDKIDITDYHKNLSEKISANKQVIKHAVVIVCCRSWYLIKYSFLRPPPIV